MIFDLLKRKRPKIRIKTDTFDNDLIVRSIDALERSKITRSDLDPQKIKIIGLIDLDSRSKISISNISGASGAMDNVDQINNEYLTSLPPDFSVGTSASAPRLQSTAPITWVTNFARRT